MGVISAWGQWVQSSGVVKGGDKVVDLVHQQRSLSPIPRSQGWACGPSACIYVCACFSFVLLVLVAFALLVFFYPCFMRVGGLINNIRGWALECVCIYIG